MKPIVKQYGRLLGILALGTDEVGLQELQLQKIVELPEDTLLADVRAGEPALERGREDVPESGGELQLASATEEVAVRQARLSLETSIGAPAAPRAGHPRTGRRDLDVDVHQGVSKAPIGRSADRGKADRVQREQEPDEAHDLEGGRLRRLRSGRRNI